MSHTKGRLKLSGTGYAVGGGNVLFDDASEADTRRLIACWNAFENWTTEDVELLGHVANVPKAQLEALSRGPDCEALRRDLGLERESHEITKRMLQDATDEIERRDATHGGNSNG